MTVDELRRVRLPVVQRDPALAGRVLGDERLAALHAGDDPHVVDAGKARARPHHLTTHPSARLFQPLAGVGLALALPALADAGAQPIKTGFYSSLAGVPSSDVEFHVRSGETVPRCGSL